MVLRRGLHRSFAESAAQDGAEVAEHGLAADDEDPGIHDGVQGVEAERSQVRLVAAKRLDGVDKTRNLQTERKWVSGGRRGQGQKCIEQTFCSRRFAVTFGARVL